MSNPNVAVGEGGAGSTDKKTRQTQRTLSKVRKKLKRNGKNSDLWMRAAEAYLELRNPRKALKCGYAALIVDSGREDARLLVSKAEKSLGSHGSAWSSDERTEAHAQEEDGESTADLALPGEPVPEESLIPLSPDEEQAESVLLDGVLEELAYEPDPSTTTVCPECDTVLAEDERWCFGCGREMKEKVETLVDTLEQRVNLARARLEEDEEDTDSLFTMGAHLAMHDRNEEALDFLNKLTFLDEEYPGLWWLKARVFEQMGKSLAAQSSIKRAMRLDIEMRGGGSRQ